MSLMAELGGVDGTRCTVYRARKNQPNVYVFACSPQEFSLDDLRDKYNGGAFRIFITRPGHTGVWRNIPIYVEEGAAKPEVSNGSETATLIAMMREGFQRQADVMKAALTPVAPAAEPITMAAILPQLPAIITAMAAAVTALRPPAPPPAAPAAKDNGIDLFIKGVELARDLGGGGDGGDTSLMSILKELVKSPMMAAAVESVASRAPQMPQQVQQRPQLAAPQPTTVAPVPTPAPPAPEVMTPNPTLAYYLGMLCTMSQNGKDPSLYADLVLDNAPDELLTPMLEADDGVAFLAQFHPSVEQHRQWFAQLIAIIREAMNAPDDTNGAAVGNVDPTAGAVIQGGPNAVVNSASERTG